MAGESVDAIPSTAGPPQTEAPEIVVIGLGNPILGDDGVGWHVCRCVQARFEDSRRLTTGVDYPNMPALVEGQPRVDFECLSLSGLALMEQMIGYTHALLIDAMSTQQVAPGKVLAFPLEALPNPAMGRLASAHDTSLPGALQMGRILGARLPEEIVLIGIETRAKYDFSEELTQETATAIPEACDLALDQIKGWLQTFAARHTPLKFRQT